jgi:hypothetical protein
MNTQSQEKIELEEQLVLLQSACDEETDPDRLHAIHAEIDEVVTQIDEVVTQIEKL